MKYFCQKYTLPVLRVKTKICNQTMIKTVQKIYSLTIRIIEKIKSEILLPRFSFSTLAFICYVYNLLLLAALSCMYIVSSVHPNQMKWISTFLLTFCICNIFVVVETEWIPRKYLEYSFNITHLDFEMRLNTKLPNNLYHRFVLAVIFRHSKQFSSTTTK